MRRSASRSDSCEAIRSVTSALVPTYPANRPCSSSRGVALDSIQRHSPPGPRTLQRGMERVPTRGRLGVGALVGREVVRVHDRLPARVDEPVVLDAEVLAVGAVDELHAAVRVVHPDRHRHAVGHGAEARLAGADPRLRAAVLAEVGEGHRKAVECPRRDEPDVDVDVLVAVRELAGQRLAGLDDAHVRVVVEQAALGPPGGEHRLVRVQHHADERLQLRRPGPGPAERMHRPVDRAQACAGVAAAGQEVGLGVRGRRGNARVRGIHRYRAGGVRSGDVEPGGEPSS